MWYVRLRNNGLVNLDNVVAIEIREEIREGKPKAFSVIGLLPSGIHHVVLRPFTTKSEAEAALSLLQERVKTATEQGIHIVGP